MLSAVTNLGFVFNLKSFMLDKCTWVVIILKSGFFPPLYNITAF